MSTLKKIKDNGFIPLIEYENTYKDYILISFPNSWFRNGNKLIKYDYNEHTYKSYDIIYVEKNELGYRIPKLKEIDLKL